MAQEGEVLEEEKPKEILLPNTTIVTHCIYKNDLPRFLECFQNDEDPYKDTILDLMNLRDESTGKTPLEIAAILGRVDLTREMLSRGADIYNTAEKGYCPWHYAAAWGRIGILKAMEESHANLQLKTSHGERAREIALRYNNSECVDFLDWAEAKQLLIELVKSIQEVVTDPAKTQGVLTKDEKNIAVNTCKEKNEWLEISPDATTKEFIMQRERMEDIMAPIMQKINDPPAEKPEKK